MDNISQSAKKINEMYTDLTYFDQYGGSVFVFIVLITMLFLIFAYMTVMKNVQPIKDDWVNQRCKPQVIPFAGLINKPDDMSVIDFTGKNFSECIQNILISITGTAIQPITYITHTISELINLILGVLQHIRALVSSIKSNLTKIAVEIMGRIGNIVSKNIFSNKVNKKENILFDEISILTGFYGKNKRNINGWIIH